MTLASRLGKEVWGTVHPYPGSSKCQRVVLGTNVAPASPGVGWKCRLMPDPGEPEPVMPRLVAMLSYV